MNDLTVIPTNGAETYRMSTDAAGLCREIVTRTAQTIQGRKYVRVEGWQALAVAHGCVASAESVTRIDDEGCKGFSAIGSIRRMSDGIEISRAEGFVGDDEATWGKRPVYARRAMAQTRAISRACRSAFAHVVVLIDANLSTTPAEEMDFAQPEPANVTPAASASIGRKTSAAAKRDGDDVKIKQDIAKCDHEGLREWHQRFDEYTATLPLSWLDSVRDMLEARMIELNGAASVAEESAALDDEFRARVGVVRGSELAGRDPPRGREAA